MVAKKPTYQFLGKVNEFFGNKLTPERQRSGVAHSTLRHRSDVAQVTAQVGSTGTILRPLRSAL
jgi:hypothetical protein